MVIQQDAGMSRIHSLQLFHMKLNLSARTARTMAHAATLLALSAVATAQFQASVPVPLPYIGAPGDGFGTSVAVDYRTAAVGSPAAGAGGQVIIYQFDADASAWVQTQVLAPPGLSGGALFGTSVAYVEGQLVPGGPVVGQLVVGAPNDQMFGRAHVFDNSTGVFAASSAPLAPIAGTIPIAFGISVATSGSVIVVGDPFAFNATGSVTVFDGAAPPALLTPAGPLAAAANFGTAVAINREDIVVGAPFNTVNAPALVLNAGTVDVFNRVGANWASMPRLQATAAIPGGEFGASVDINTSFIAVGAPEMVFGNITGNVYSYAFDAASSTYGGGVLVRAGLAGEALGTSVGVAGDRIAMGAPGAGSVYMARLMPGTLNMWETPLAAPFDREQPNQPVTNGLVGAYGNSLSFDTDLLVLGASNAGGIGANTGAVAGYRLRRTNIQHACFGGIDPSDIAFPLQMPTANTYTATPCPCANDSAMGTFSGCLHGAPVSLENLNTGGQLLGYGTASIGLADLRFEVRGLPAQSAAILMSGPALLPNPLVAMGPIGVTGGPIDGLRCIGGGTTRHGTRLADAAGTIGMNNVGWGAPEGGIPNLMVPMVGGVLNFQAFYRTPVNLTCETGLNTTNAVSVTFEM